MGGHKSELTQQLITVTVVVTTVVVVVVVVVIAIIIIPNRVLKICERFKERFYQYHHPSLVRLYGQVGIQTQGFGTLVSTLPTAPKWVSQK